MEVELKERVHAEPPRVEPAWTDTRRGRKFCKKGSLNALPHFILTHSTSKNTLQGKISTTLSSKTSEIQVQITHKDHFQGNFLKIYIVTLFQLSNFFFLFLLV